MSKQMPIVICPRCDSANRYPIDRSAERARCGSCKEALFPGLPTELTAENFERHLGRTELPLVVDFWAPWCGPCLTMAPHFAQAASQLCGQIQLAKLDTEQAQALAGRYGIRSIPTLIRFENGVEVARQSGALSTAQILDWINHDAS